MTCDGIFIAEDGIVKFHTPVLVLALPYLQETLDHLHLKEDLILVLRDFRVEVIQVFMDLVYLGRSPVGCHWKLKETKLLLKVLGVNMRLSEPVLNSNPLETEVTEFSSECSIVPFTDGFIVKRSKETKHDVSNFSLLNRTFPSPTSPSTVARPSLSVLKLNCSRACLYRCGDTLLKMSSKVLAETKDKFKDKFRNSVEIRNNLLSHLISQEVIGVNTDCYVVHEHKYCSSYFSHITGISKYIVETTLRDFLKGCRKYKHWNKGVSKQITEPTSQFISWMKIYGDVNGQHSPEIEQTILRKILNKHLSISVFRVIDWSSIRLINSLGFKD